MNKKILLTSLMSIAMLSSVAAGATYALFTAEDTTNISVTTGKVQVKSTVAGITHYTMGEMQADGWVNGGKATYENGVVTVDRITPGDRVDIAIDVENLSNVAARYRTLVEIVKDNGLADGLEITLVSSKGTESRFTGFAYQDWDSLDAIGVEETVTVRIELPVEAGNEYQDKTTEIEFFVEAVQGNADFAVTSGGLASNENGELLVSTATDLKIVRTNVNNKVDSYEGKVLKLTNNIDLDNAYWTPIGLDLPRCFSGTFDGAGHTISNFKVETVNNAGLFGYTAYGNNTIKNLTVEDAEIKANDYAGAILGRGYTRIDNCHVKNVTVVTTPYLVGDKLDGGAKAGGIVGQMLEGANNTVTNCSATDVEIYAFRDLGGVVGMVHNNNSVSGNTASNVTLGYLLNELITEDENENAGAIYGRVQASATATPTVNSAENQAFDLVYATYDAVSLRTFANNVNGGNTYANKTVVMISDVDLENKDWEPIGQTGRTEFKGIFDGRNHTIYNLNVNSYDEAGKYYSSGLFGWIEGHGTNPIVVKNVTVENAVVKGNHNVAVIVGYLTRNALVDNVHVINAVVDGKYHDSDADGDKVGAIVGNLTSEEETKLTNSSAKDCVITAGRDAGQLVGAAAPANVVNCSATNVNVSANGTGTGANITNDLVGRKL